VLFALPEEVVLDVSDTADYIEEVSVEADVGTLQASGTESAGAVEVQGQESLAPRTAEVHHVVANGATRAHLFLFVLILSTMLLLL